MDTTRRNTKHGPETRTSTHAEWVSSAKRFVSEGSRFDFLLVDPKTGTATGSGWVSAPSAVAAKQAALRLLAGLSDVVVLEPTSPAPKSQQE